MQKYCRRKTTKAPKKKKIGFSTKCFSKSGNLCCKQVVHTQSFDCDIAGYKQKCYLGSCETTFKDRFGNHKKSFNHLKHKNDTELSKEFWEIKKRNGTPKLTWKIIRICTSYNPNSKRCLLCLNEKYEIATYKGNNLLNKSTEIINTCRHRSKYKLANCETIG